MGAWCMLFFHKKNRTELEKDPKKYIQTRLSWLEDRGYVQSYFFKNGENAFTYESPRITVYFLYSDLPEFACSIGYGVPRHTQPLYYFLDPAGKDAFDALSPEEKVDFAIHKLPEIIHRLDSR